jgi:hypothetical protein
MPYDWRILCVATFISCALIQFLEINDIISVNDRSQIVWIEQFDHFSRHDFVKSFFKSIKLFFYAFVQQKVCVQLAVLLLVVLCDLDFGSIFDQILNNFFAKMFLLNREIHFQILKTLICFHELFKSILNVRLDVGQVVEEFRRKVIFLIAIEELFVQNVGERNLEVN